MAEQIAVIGAGPAGPGIAQVPARAGNGAVLRDVTGAAPVRGVAAHPDAAK